MSIAMRRILMYVTLDTCKAHVVDNEVTPHHDDDGVCPHMATRGRGREAEEKEKGGERELGK